MRRLGLESGDPDARRRRARAWWVGIAVALCCCTGCATVLGVAGVGRETTTTAAAATACLAAADDRVLERWGEVSGSLLVSISNRARPLDSGVMQLGAPVDVAAAFGDLYVLDGIHRQVLKLDRNSQSVRQRIAVAGLDVRARMYVDRALSVYVANPATADVRQYDIDGRELQVFASPGEMTDPVDVAIAESDGSVYVADGLSARVLVFNATGAVRQVVGADLSAQFQFSSARAIAIGPDQLFVVDELARQVHFLSADGQYRYAFGADSLVRPGSVAIDEDNRVFVADNGDNTIKVFRGGELLSVFGGRDDVRRVHFEQIAGMWLSEGLLYVADPGTASIKIFRVSAPCA